MYKSLEITAMNACHYSSISIGTNSGQTYVLGAWVGPLTSSFARPFARIALARHCSFACLLVIWKGNNITLPRLWDEKDDSLRSPHLMFYYSSGLNRFAARLKASSIACLWWTLQMLTERCFRSYVTTPSGHLMPDVKVRTHGLKNKALVHIRLREYNFR